MEKLGINIFHTVNAGLYLHAGETGLLIDGIHQGGSEGCSNMPQELESDMMRHRGIFDNLSALLFTHLHPDHYDKLGVMFVMSGENPPQLYAPGVVEPLIQERPLPLGGRAIQIGQAEIFALETIHDGRCFCHEPHWSFLIRMGGEMIFIAGDALLESDRPELRTYLGRAPLEMAFLNYYQLASRGGRDFLQRYAPRRVFLYHLPFPKDDKYHYYSLCQTMLRHYPPNLPLPEILTHMAWIDGKAPS